MFQLQQDSNIIGTFIETYRFNTKQGTSRYIIRATFKIKEQKQPNELFISTKSHTRQGHTLHTHFTAPTEWRHFDKERFPLYNRGSVELVSFQNDIILYYSEITMMGMSNSTIEKSHFLFLMPSLWLFEAKIHQHFNP